MTTCPGPLVWFDVDMEPPAAILECATCGYLIVTGNWHNEAHSETPLLREGIAT